MSDQKKVAVPCKHGATCAYHAMGKCKFTHEKGGHKGHSPVKTGMKLHSDAIIKMGRALVRRKQALDTLRALALKAEAPPAPKGFVMVPDTKSAFPTPDSLASMQELYDSELKVARATLASVYGTKPVSFKLPVTTTLSTVITTGLASTPLPILITDSPEFTSLAALFDEYRFTRGEFLYTMNVPTPTIVLGTSSISGASHAAIGFDASDATAATNVRDILQLQYHSQQFPRIVPTPTAGTYVGVYGKQDNSPYVLKWSYAHTDTVTGNGGVVAPGMWKSTQGNVSTYPDGSLKPFYVTGETTVKPAFEGVQYWFVEFRCRT